MAENTAQKKVAYLLSEANQKELLALPFFQNRGKMFIGRCGIDDDQGRRELAFSNAIKQYHEQYGVNQLGGGSEQDNEIVFTVFQWLTTNIGGSVLEEALKATGRKIVPIKE